MDNKHFGQAKWIAAPEAYLGSLKSKPDGVLPLGKWIWPEAYTRAHLICNFQASGIVAKALLEFQGDNLFDLYLNGKPIIISQNMNYWESGLQNVGSFIRSGDNHIAIRGYLSNDPKCFLSAIRGALQIEYENGNKALLQTNENWENGARGDYWQNTEPKDWQTTPIVAGLSVTELHPQQIRRSCYFRRDFHITTKITHAVVIATAKGFYELFVNGKKVGDEFLTPDSSERLVYQKYDVTEYLLEGYNVIAAITGNGWYNSHGWGKVIVRKPEFIAELSVTLEDGRNILISTDASWKVTHSPLLEDDLQFGERYDARIDTVNWNKAGIDTSLWVGAEVSAHQEEYPEICQNYEPIRIVRRLRPKYKRKLNDNNWLFDFGENTSGRIRVKVRNSKSGDMICIRMYERLDYDGNPVWGIYSDVFYHNDNAPGGKAAMALKNMDVYICRGDPEETYQPRFTYTGFRYACIEGYPGEPEFDDIEFMVMHNDLLQTGTFTASSRLLSDINSAVLRGYRSNIHGGPTDCPTREKNFWNGDIQAFVTTACWYLNNFRFLAHWTMRGRKLKGGAYGWDDEEYIVPWVLYRYYGDKSILHDKYPALRQLIDSRGEILAHGNARWRDHHATKNVPEAFFAACYQCHMYETMSKIAATLGKNEDSERFLNVFNKLRIEFNNRYFDKTNADYSPHSQSGVILPLAFNLVPENMRKNVADMLNHHVIMEDFHPTVGFIAMPYLLPLLCDFEHEDTALKLVTQKTFPSWGFMLNTGATTITESWWGQERSPEDSMNHYCFGSIGRWFFEYLGGIRLDPEITAFKRFILKPVFYVDQSHVNVTYLCPYGEIKSAWLNVNTNGYWEWKFSIPEGTTAIVHLPGKQPQEYNPGDYTCKVPYHRMNTP